MLSAVRRSLLAIVAAGVVALVLKMRGEKSTAPNEGGWRELSGQELN